MPYVAVIAIAVLACNTPPSPVEPPVNDTFVQDTTAPDETPMIDTLPQDTTVNDSL
jgi:hypothetical protein